MANNNQSKTRSTRRSSKAELERKSNYRMIATTFISLVLIFAALKLGAVGVLAYNLIRLLVGSLAYLAILA